VDKIAKTQSTPNFIDEEETVPNQFNIKPKKKKRKKKVAKKVEETAGESGVICSAFGRIGGRSGREKASGSDQISKWEEIPWWEF
jgi:hypothetical protein